MKHAPASVRTQSSHTRLQIIGYYGAFFTLGLVVVAIGPTLPALAQQTGSQKSEISSVMLARSFGFIAGSLLAGRFYDRVKGHPLLTGALLLLAASSSLIPLTHHLWQLVALFLIQGVMGSTISVGGNTLLIWACRNNAGSILSGLHFIWGAGAFLSPIIAARAMSVGGIRLAYWILATIALPVGIWIIRQPNPQPPRKAESPSAGNVIIPLALLICSFLFLYTGTEACFGNWIYTYALETRLGNVTSAAYLNSIFWGMLTLGRLLNISLATRLRPRTILTMDLAGALLSVLAMLLWQRSATVLWVAAGTLGLSLGSIFPTVVAFASRRMALSGQLTGIFFASASAGSMCLPWLVGQFLDGIGPQMLPETALSALIAEVIIFIMMMRYPQRTIPVQPQTEESEDVQAASELAV